VLAGPIGAGAALAAFALAPSALGATIEVTPGPNAINKALAKAHNGDLLRIHERDLPRVVRHQQASHSPGCRRSPDD